MLKSGDKFYGLINQSKDFWSNRFNLPEDQNISQEKSYSNFKKVTYVLKHPLIVKEKYIFTVNEYYAAKKIFKFLKNAKNKKNYQKLREF